MDNKGQSPTVDCVADRSRPRQAGARRSILRIVFLAPAATGALLVAGIGLAGPAAAAGVERPQLLVDRAPTSTHVEDRVLDGSLPGRAASGTRSGTARAAASPERRYGLRAGGSVTVQFASGYAVDQSVGQSYVAFLDGLPHGSELGDLTIVITPPASIAKACGGQSGDGILACYSGQDETMVVPGEEIVTAEDGVTTSYVIAHEYGHHIAANRLNTPFPALAYGPKRWASYEMVCARTAKNQLAPGDEGSRYRANPGEAWAETYAQITYPNVGWGFTPLLQPDAGALAAARADVLQPWTKRTVKTFSGSFARTGKKTKAYAISLTLDGTFAATLTGPKGARYDLKVTSDGASETVRPNGRKATLSYDVACRTKQTERVTLTAVRRSGRGPFSLTVRYAG